MTRLKGEAGLPIRNYNCDNVNASLTHWNRSNEEIEQRKSIISNISVFCFVRGRFGFITLPKGERERETSSHHTERGGKRKTAQGRWLRRKGEERREGEQWAPKKNPTGNKIASFDSNQKMH